MPLYPASSRFDSPHGDQKLDYFFPLSNESPRSGRSPLPPDGASTRSLTVTRTGYSANPEEGTIVMSFSGQIDIDLLLPGIVNVEQVAALIDKSRREARHRRGWYLNDD